MQFSICNLPPSTPSPLIRPTLCLAGRFAWIVLTCTILALAGCGVPELPQFRLNTEGRDPQQIRLTQAETIKDTLEKLFGTADQSQVLQGVDLQLPRLQMAAGAIRSDVRGNQWGLYRQHCSPCHGISGDGAGPVAALQNPYPRDFRRGLFKFTSTAGGAKPVGEDLHRTLRRGIPGTSMPSFDTLGDREIDALIEYVKYLSIRGETELFLLQLVVDEDEYPLDVDEVIEDDLLPTAQLWADAREMVVVPPPPPPTDTAGQLAASIARGQELYGSEDARCVECHGPDGHGDGEQAELYDDWNKPKIGMTPQQTKRLARLYRLPTRRLQARDFSEGTFLGGDRPIDLYWRTCVGIKGTPMPAAGPAPGSAGALSPEEIWHVVNYVLSRP